MNKLNLGILFTVLIFLTSCASEFKLSKENQEYLLNLNTEKARTNIERLVEQANKLGNYCVLGTVHQYGRSGAENKKIIPKGGKLLAMINDKIVFLGYWESASDVKTAAGPGLGLLSVKSLANINSGWITVDFKKLERIRLVESIENSYCPNGIIGYSIGIQEEGENFAIYFPIRKETAQKYAATFKYFSKKAELLSDK